MRIDKNSNKPIYMQIYDCIVDEIITGYLMPEERLPSRRGLCRQLKISQINDGIAAWEKAWKRWL